MKRLLYFTLIASILAGCGETDGTITEQEDAREAEFTVPGKADGLTPAEGSPLAVAVLELANTASYQVLDVDVGLSSRAVDNIVQARMTAPFATLADLDAVPWVGPYALQQLIDYARAHGLVDTTVSLPSGFGAIEIHPPADVTLPDADFTDENRRGLRDLEFEVESTKVHVLQDRSTRNVVNSGYLGEPIVVAAGEYLVYLGAGYMSVTVEDQEIVDITAGRLEVDFQARCPAGSSCKYKVWRHPHPYNGDGGARVTPYDDADFGTGIFVLPGRYRTTMTADTGRRLEGSTNVRVGEGETHRIAASGFAGLRLNAPQKTVPTCDFSADEEDYTVSYDRVVGFDQTEPNRVDYSYGDDVAYVVWRDGTRSRELSIGETFWSGPGRYIVVVNGSVTAVELTAGDVTEIDLGRIEVTDSDVLGGPGTYKVILTAHSTEREGDRVEKAFVLGPHPECSHGTGYYVLPHDRYSVRIDANTIHRREEFSVGGVVSLPGVEQVGQVFVGTPSGAQYPLWNPAVPPRYWIGEDELTYKNDYVHVFDEQYCVSRGVNTGRCLDWRSDGPWGPVLLGDTVRLPAGEYMFALNGSVNRVEVAEGETTNIPVGRVEVSDAFDGTYTVREPGDDPLLGADIPTGTGLNLLPAHYIVKVSHGEGYEQEFDISVP